MNTCKKIAEEIVLRESVYGDEIWLKVNKI